MGQYWIPVNLDKREFIDPHRLGAGLKLHEQVGTHPGTGAALLILCAAMPEPRGGGDLALDTDVARRTIGRWTGDRIALIGDYAEHDDLPARFTADRIYEWCYDGTYRDISADVCAVLEAELGGTFTGSGWRRFVYQDGSEFPPAMAPDLTVTGA